MNYSEIELTNINNGAAVDLFAAEMKKVVDNIMDYNTKPDAVREITLKIKIKPNSEREAAVTTISATSKLANIMQHESMMFIANQGGKTGCFVSNSKQIGFEFDEKPEVKDITKVS